MSRTVLMRALGYLGGVLAILAGVYRLSQGDEPGAAVAFGIGFSLLGVTDLVGRLAEKLKAILPDWIGLDDLIDRLIDRLADRPAPPIVVRSAAAAERPDRADSVVIARTPAAGTVALDPPGGSGVTGPPVRGIVVKHADTGEELFVIETYGGGAAGLEFRVTDGQAVVPGDVLIERRRP